MANYCKVLGYWTTAISDIDTRCRYYSPNGCQKKESCDHKTSDPKAKFIGKRVKDITDNGFIFDDGSVFQFGMSEGLRREFAEAGIV